jgi:hypothetical protein
MKTAIICYDLKTVKPFENVIIKAELVKKLRAITDHAGLNVYTFFPEWVTLSFPDTTLLAPVEDNVSARDLTK